MLWQPTNVDILSFFNCDQCAVNLVDDIVDEFPVGYKLVATGKNPDDTCIGKASENISSSEMISLYNNILLCY
jgi:hypothetical protein